MKIDLTGKNAIVCGSSSGIGKAIALEMARCGANILLLARNEKMLENVKAELDTSFEQKHHFLALDFQEYNESSLKVLHWLKNNDGADILINNSGGPAPGLLYNASIKEFHEAFERHLYFSHSLFKHILPIMKNRNYGRIINIISLSVRQPIDKLGVSNTLRAAMASWAKTLSRELAEFGITINNILPGYTDTHRLKHLFKYRAEEAKINYEDVISETVNEIPLKRLGKPEEMAYLACFLASEYAAYITGTSIPVDGGILRAL